MRMMMKLCRMKMKKDSCVKLWILGVYSLVCGDIELTD
jgi:hypothetical protein